MKNNTVNFWIKQIIITFIYLILLVPSYLFISPKISSILVGLLTTIFIWIMNITFAKDYQTKNDIKLEAYKSKLSNYTLVTKLQFELEFKIYTEIFDLLFNLYIETDKLKPPIDTSPTDDEKKKRLKSFSNLYNILSLTMNKYRPFYPKEIYEKIKDTRNICFQESTAFEIELIEKSIRYSHKISIERKEKIKKNLDEITNLIKNRITNMKIIED